MAKKAKKRITVNAFKKAVAKGLPETITIQWEGIDIEIKPTLSFGEMYGFVNGVVSSCIDATTGTYNAEAKDFAIKAMVLENYANFTLPKNPEKSYEMIYRTEAYFKVLDHINPVQFNEICTAIDKKIDYMLQSNVEMATKQINSMLTSMEAIQEQLSSVFGKVSDEDIKNLVNVLINKNVDEGKLMNAFLDAKEHEAVRAPIIG